MPDRSRLAAAGAIGVLVGALAVGVPAGRGATSPAPPVIHERFTPLRCAGNPGSRTHVELIGCAEHEILRADDRIDALNRMIFGELAGAAARRDFVVGHDAWLAYRTRFCASVGDADRGGTEAEVLDVQCVAGVDEVHIGDLGDFAEDFPGS